MRTHKRKAKRKNRKAQQTSRIQEFDKEAGRWRGEGCGKNSGRSVEEIGGASKVSSILARERTIIPNGDEFAAEERDDIISDPGNQSKNKLSTNKDSGRDTNLVSVLGVCSRDINTVHDGSSKIIGNEASPDFLNDGSRLTHVIFRKANGIFEGPERGFNTPAAEIEFFELYLQEIIRGKVGHEGLKFTGGEFETNDTKGQWIEVAAVILNEIERGIFTNETDIAIREGTFF